ncbi:MAG TPA: hypothetical protein VFL94_03060 [Actinomycetales bacterium]|nr:hypothetical protein [Actinomycetales bacterium]
MEPESLTELPPNKAVKDVFEDLLGRDVEVAPSADRTPVGPGHLTMEAVYVDDQMRMRAVIVTDLALTAYAAAAIGLVPPGGAEAAIEDGELSESLVDNISEVFNIMAGLFNTAGSPHVRLYAWYPPGEPAPADVADLTASIVGRNDLDVSIAGYGDGQIGIVIA